MEGRRKESMQAIRKRERIVRACVGGMQGVKKERERGGKELAGACRRILGKKERRKMDEGDKGGERVRKEEGVSRGDGGEYNWLMDKRWYQSNDACRRKRFVS